MRCAVRAARHTRRMLTMAKSHDAKREEKKKPTKTLKEKRQEKKAKKSAT